MQKGKVLSESRITGEVIIDQLTRNMELGRFDMAYSILLPCIFSIYLHPDDYARLVNVLDLIKEDARRALSSRLAELNKRGFVFAKRGGKRRKQYRIASKDWSLEFFPDSEGAVPQGDVEIHSELNETPQPGYHGAKTTLLGREPSVTGGVGRQTGSTGTLSDARRPADRVFAEIRYEDDSGPQLYVMTQHEITIGRGGDDLPVSVALYTNDEVSREHVRLRWDASKNHFVAIDKSRNGTWVNGKRLAKGVEETVPERAEIGIAEVLTLTFEAKR